VLRHQLIVVGRRLHGRVRLTDHDRWFFIQLYRRCPSILRVLTIVRPETLVRRHRAGFRCYWRWKSRRRGGRPQIEMELRALIRQMSTENQLLAAPRKTAQAWVWHRSINGRQVHGETTWTAKSGMVDLSAKPRSGHCRHGSVRSPDHWLQIAVWLRDCKD
jgi:hypothetical protein